MSVSALLLAALWSAPVQVAPGPEAWVACPAPGWLESVEGHRLRMVHLVDGRGIQIPYRLLEPSAEPEEWFSVEVRNRRQTASGHSLEAVVPAGEVVDQLRLGMLGEEGVVEVEVEVDDGGSLVRGVRMGRLGGAEQLEAVLPNTDARRLFIHTSTVLAGLEPSWVELRRVHEWALVTDATRAAMAVREEAGAESDDVFVLSPVGAVERIQAVQFRVEGPAVFNRRVRIRGWVAGEGDWRTIGAGSLARLPLADGRPGIENLEISVQPGAYLRLQIRAHRGTEAPLRVAGVEAHLARRWLLFPRPDTPDDLKLVRSDRLRSWSLEEAAQIVPPLAAGRARIGARRAEVVPEPDVQGEGPAGGGRLLNVLFVAAAGLLALLAWRVLANRSAR